jgi:hypothetical protein
LLRAFEHQPVIAEVVAVVAGQHHHGVVAPPVAIERGEHAADRIVDAGDHPAGQPSRLLRLARRNTDRVHAGEIGLVGLAFRDDVKVTEFIDSGNRSRLILDGTGRREVGYFLSAGFRRSDLKRDLGQQNQITRESDKDRTFSPASTNPRAVRMPL